MDDQPATPTEVLSALALFRTPPGDDFGLGKMMSDLIMGGYRLAHDERIEFVEPDGVMVVPADAYHDVLRDYLELGIRPRVAVRAIQAGVYGARMDELLTPHSRLFVEQAREAATGGHPARRSAFDSGIAVHYIAKFESQLDTPANDPAR